MNNLNDQKDVNPNSTGLSLCFLDLTLKREPKVTRLKLNYAIGERKKIATTKSKFATPPSSPIKSNKLKTYFV